MSVCRDVERDADAFSCGLDDNDRIRFIVAGLALCWLARFEVGEGAVHDFVPLPGADKADVSKGLC